MDTVIRFLLAFGIAYGVCVAILYLYELRRFPVTEPSPENSKAITSSMNRTGIIVASIVAAIVAAIHFN